MPYFLILIPLFWPERAHAHAFGQQYTLPVPFWLYAYGGGSAVILSFLLIGYFIQSAQKHAFYPRFDISQTLLMHLLTHDTTKSFAKGISLTLFFLTIVSGLFGTLIPTENFNMTFFWIIVLLGLTYTTAVFGNLYAVLNPWRTLVVLWEKIFGEMKQRFSYPKSLGYYPAFFVYIVFIWFEIIGITTPLSLSHLLLLYTAFTFAGVFLFGKTPWLGHGEFFSVFFGLISHISILEYEKKRWYLRPPFVGLLKQTAKHVSLLFFIMFMLSSTAFDGFGETKVWRNTYFTLAQPLLQTNFGDHIPQILSTIGLFLAFMLFSGLYLLFIFLMKITIKTKNSVYKLALAFAYSLVPIGLVYNIAHYYTLLAIQGQFIIRLVSDPFGTGLNLLGTSNFIPNIGLINTNTIWHSQVFFILLGHIAAIYLAHLIAVKTLASRRDALISQLPMLFLMVVYTVAGLWILSQPLTSGF